jgi:hypothetical protein
MTSNLDTIPFPIQSRYIGIVKNMFRFNDAINPSIHLAGLPFPGRKGQTCQAGSEESEHIFDNGYSRITKIKGIKGLRAPPTYAGKGDLADRC